MNTRTACLLTGILSLVIGMGLGWTFRTQIEPHNETKEHVKQLATTRPLIVSSEPQTKSEALGRDSRVGEGNDFSISDRMVAVAWFKDMGHSIQFAVTSDPENAMNTKLARILNLSPEETGLLQASMDRARLEMKMLARANATGEISKDGSELVVQVLPSPQEGGVIHDALLARFEQILGPERFELFNKVAREGFEQSYDAFGINSVIYRIDLKAEQIGKNGIQPYKIIRESSNPDGSRSVINTQLNIDGIAKMYPVLIRFISSEIDVSPKP